MIVKKAILYFIVHQSLHEWPSLRTQKTHNKIYTKTLVGVLSKIL